MVGSPGPINLAANVLACRGQRCIVVGGNKIATFASGKQTSLRTVPDTRTFEGVTAVPAGSSRLSALREVRASCELPFRAPAELVVERVVDAQLRGTHVGLRPTVVYGAASLTLRLRDAEILERGRMVQGLQHGAVLE